MYTTLDGDHLNKKVLICVPFDVNDNQILNCIYRNINCLDELWSSLEELAYHFVSANTQS